MRTAAIRILCCAMFASWICANELSAAETHAKLFVTVTVPNSLADRIELHAVELEKTGTPQWAARTPIRTKITTDKIVVEAVPPGTWTARVTGRLKNGFAFRGGETTVEVAAGVDRHVTLTLTDIVYRGRVTRDGLAISGTINVYPAEKGRGLRHTVAKLGRDGKFQVLLGGKGRYAVMIEDSGRRSVRLDRYITFDDPAEEISIELPIGREIRGRVINRAGLPVEDVTISATRQVHDPAGFVGVRSSADGTFVLDGLTSGNWELTAHSKNERSAAMIVPVGEDDLDGIILVVDPALRSLQ